MCVFRQIVNFHLDFPGYAWLCTQPKSLDLRKFPGLSILSSQDFLSIQLLLLALPLCINCVFPYGVCPCVGHPCRSEGSPARDCRAFRRAQQWCRGSARASEILLCGNAWSNSLMTASFLSDPQQRGGMSSQSYGAALWCEAAEVVTPQKTRIRGPWSSTSLIKFNKTVTPTPPQASSSEVGSVWVGSLFPNFAAGQQGTLKTLSTVTKLTVRTGDIMIAPLVIVCLANYN